MQGQLTAEAGPSRPRSRAGDGPRKPRSPFVSEDHRPNRPDGRYRVVLISSGSVASIKIPEIVGSLVRNPQIDLQVVGTAASLHFYDQAKVDDAVRKSIGRSKSGEDEDMADDDIGVKVWKDEDEWSDWKQVGDPILHIELRRWADLVLVAPCSANMLAKIAGGICDNLATSLLRALSPDTPTILFPAMNTHMYSHPLTNDHLNLVQEKLGYMVSGPQGAGRLACGDEGPGKMTDWRDIVTIVEDMAIMYRAKFAEARIFRELGPGTSAQGSIPLDMTSPDQGLASRGLASLIAADKSRTLDDPDFSGIHFSPFKDPLEYNGFQPGLRVERKGDLEMREPTYMSPLPPLGNAASDNGWRVKHMPLGSNSAQPSTSRDTDRHRHNGSQSAASTSKDPLEYNGRQPGLSVGNATVDWKEPPRMAGLPPVVVRPGGGYGQPNGGWRSEPTDTTASDASKSWDDQFKGNIRDPIEINGGQPSLPAAKTSSMGEPIRMGTAPGLIRHGGATDKPAGGWSTNSNNSKG